MIELDSLPIKEKTVCQIYSDTLELDKAIEEATTIYQQQKGIPNAQQSEHSR